MTQRKDFAAGTKTAIATTEGQIKDMLRKNGAETVAILEEPGRAIVAFHLHGRAIQFRLPLPKRDDQRFTHWQARNKYGPAGVLTQRSPDAAIDQWMQASRERWRQLHLCIKAKLEAVAQDIETFDEAFLPHIVMPDGETVGEKVLKDMQAQLAGAPLKPLLPAPSGEHRRFGS